MTSYLGIDPSLNSTGWVELSGKQVDSGLVSAPKGVVGTARLQALRDRLRALVDPGARVVAVEGYAFSRAQGAHQIGELGGVIRLLLLDKGIPSIAVPPTTLKKWITGKGTGKKDQMRLNVYKRWGFEHDSNDVVDAYALAQFARAWAQDEGKGFAELRKKCEIIVGG